MDNFAVSNHTPHCIKTSCQLKKKKKCDNYKYDTWIYFVVKDFSILNCTSLLIQATKTAAISVFLAVKGKGHQSLNPIYK